MKVFGVFQARSCIHTHLPCFRLLCIRMSNEVSLCWRLEYHTFRLVVTRSLTAVNQRGTVLSSDAFILMLTSHFVTPYHFHA